MTAFRGWKGFPYPLFWSKPMAMRTRSQLTVQHPDAAGIDVGGKSHFVAVPPDRSETPVREFGCYT